MRARSAFCARFFSPRAAGTWRKKLPPGVLEPIPSMRLRHRFLDPLEVGSHGDNLLRHAPQPIQTSR
jgi:hypothetical protein